MNNNNVNVNSPRIIGSYAEVVKETPLGKKAARIQKRNLKNNTNSEKTTKKTEEVAQVVNEKDETPLKKELNAALKKIKLLENKDLNVQGAHWDLEIVKTRNEALIKENDMLKGIINKFIDEEAENEKGITLPNIRSLEVTVAKSNRLVQNMQEFRKEMAVFETEIGLDKKETVEDFQAALNKFDPRYLKFQKNYQVIKRSFDTVSTLINNNIKAAAKFVAIPVTYHDSISAKQDISVDIFNNNEKVFDEKFVACKQNLGLLNDENAKIQLLFTSAKNQLDVIENKAVFAKNNWTHTIFSLHHGVTVRLSPYEKAFYEELKVETKVEEVKDEVKAEETIVAEVKEAAIEEAAKDITLEVNIEEEVAVSEIALEAVAM